MKLSEALAILNLSRDKVRARKIFLVCGFTPLHLKTFLAAHVQSVVFDSRIEVITGVYGDLPGTLGCAPDGSELVVVLEWADLDPRLGYRRLGGWGPAHTADITDSVHRKLNFLAERILGVADSSSITLCLPSIPLPPFSGVPSWLLSSSILALFRYLNEFALSLSQHSSVRIVNSCLPLQFTAAQPFDLKSELKSGFPYSMAHASNVAAAAARALAGQRPKKGLITDLDDTLWSGIIGEDGIDGVSWTLDRESQIHGIYQQLLNSFASGGTLLAIASKNEDALVKLALEQMDLVVDKANLYPVVVNWGAKSESVRKILDCWNIGAADVVFVDDSPMELAEVKSAYPDMECVLFKADNHDYSYNFFFQLQDFFGKTQVTNEDRLRLRSIKQTTLLQNEREATKSEDAFLQGLKAVLTVRFSKTFTDSRPFELINKTNQFNLNGIRFDLMNWKQLSKDPHRHLVVVDYKDKYGPLGVIAVATGTRSGKTFNLDAWIMSCRAFSRRIEYRTMDVIYSHLHLDSIKLQFSPTERNAPIQQYLDSILGRKPDENILISKVDFYKNCPFLYHTVEIHSDYAPEAE